MRFSQIPSPAEATAILLLLAGPAASSVLICDKLVTDTRKFNLKPLFEKGPHSVTISQQVGANSHNTTFTTDLCHALKRKGDVDDKQKCPHNTRVCAVERLVGTGDSKVDVIEDAFAVAGNLQQYGGGSLDHEIINLSSSDSNADAEKQGVRIILKGGFHTGLNSQKRQQRAIIEFICDEKFEGDEAEWTSEDEYVPGGDDSDNMRVRSVADDTDPLLYVSDEEGGGGGDDDKSKPVQLGDNEKQALIFNSYGPLESDKDVDVLRLTWKTKYACPDRRAEPGEDSPSSHWGFFTWMVMIVFLGTASYLIFGSWLNYNRYGARGWDLLPHGDTIRDIPYLMKDWTRRALNTVQGSGSRGGYSAV
ncbi:hypothetical protein JX266_011307 [Neoarthrinium moseri]|uniref:uncharacterized protein n=1 Tax=Neoarthrinium moseri TaxID=1658444 RepID=UPI001FDE4BB7|nr:uncharacterized protein JN550_011505 [Neoarthrinium moseri]KAI1842553.1 hypothetical protein JX266_011307 [Neoarthrinium moseri]KAI1860353.1 hypothetical protein JN550_011505 [Neoarthrinium moseri]